MSLRRRQERCVCFWNRRGCDRKSTGSQSHTCFFVIQGPFGELYITKGRITVCCRSSRSLGSWFDVQRFVVLHPAHLIWYPTVCCVLDGRNLLSYSTKVTELRPDADAVVSTTRCENKPRSVVKVTAVWLLILRGSGSFLLTTLTWKLDTSK